MNHAVHLAIESLQSKLPSWVFQPYSQNPMSFAIACYPPQGRVCLDAWNELREIAPIQSACGVLYTIYARDVK